MTYDIDIKEGRNTIEMLNGWKFTYRFTPAKFSRGAPLLIIASASGTTVPSKFNRSDWNVLSVIDSCDSEGYMTAYLGKGGDFFIKELFSELIQEAIDKCACVPKENLFFYSSSMASTAALIQGILLEARAVYLNSPIIRLHDSTIYKVKEKNRDKLINFVIPYNMKDIIEADGVKFMKAHKNKKTPTFIICDSMHQSEPWLENFLEEQTLYFVNACKEEGIDVHLELMDTEGHIIHHTTQEIIALFEKHTPPKYLDIFTVTTSLDNNILQVNSELGKDYPVTGDEKFAFYLMYKEEKIEVKNYGEDNKVSFVLDKEIDMKEVGIRAFVKSTDGKALQKIVQNI